MDNIHWSIDALIDFDENIEFLEKRFTEKEILNFTAKTDDVLKIISKEPKTFKAIKYKNIHAVPIIPQITLYYKIINNIDIELVRFWNNAKNPDDLEL